MPQFIHFMVHEHLDCFQFLTITNASVNILVHIHMCAFLLGTSLGMELLSHKMVIPILFIHSPFDK